MHGASLVASAICVYKKESRSSGGFAFKRTRDSEEAAKELGVAKKPKKTLEEEAVGDDQLDYEVDNGDEDSN
jgi:hypothetical protein